MTEGNQTQAIFKLAIPFFLANVVNLVVLFADRVWIGVLGTTYLAAVGMAHAALVICVTTIMSPGIGTLTGVAKSVGANDADAVSGYVRNGLFIGILTGVAFALGAMFVPDLLMSMMDQSGDNSSAVVAAASGYLTISLSGLLVQAPLYVLTFALQGAGKAKAAFRLQSIAPIINLILDPVLIFDRAAMPIDWLPCAGLGLNGAALASVIGYGVALIIALIYVPRVLGISLWSEGLSGLKTKLIQFILKVGVPGTIEQLVRSAAILLLVRILSPFGSAVLAAYTASIMVIMFLIFPGLALGQATAALVGQNLGAKKPMRAYTTALTSIGVYVLFMVVASLFIFWQADQLIAVFDRSPLVIEEGALILRRYTFCFPLVAFAIIVSKVFAGSGRTLPPMLSSIIAHLVIQIPLAWWWSQTYGQGGAYWAMVVAFWIHGSLNIIFFVWWRRDTLRTHASMKKASDY
ncbi:MAG: MATE family efflux transporter [Bradymonadia bacterium]